ncbi:hypothetical protein [Microcoleus sp. FACHB-672]|uniref:hypothetical protein n=1 Tax=Microcoleus sp. FACHB-672 TaxID=2692825 RepID=UPI001683A674|nr:hypothetical protein [Microcoleus sp. FACHB-672]MBD2040305.1 hypothetical protein [Microcoleus sp. FACHB-672]
MSHPPDGNSFMCRWKPVFTDGRFCLIGNDFDPTRRAFVLAGQGWDRFSPN